MKKLRIVVLSLMCLVVLAVGLISIRSIFKGKPGMEVSSMNEVKNKTDQRILRALQLIERMPNSSEAYNQLAAAYMQKARETANFSFNANANDAIDRSLSVEPDNYDALKLKAKLQLTYHRFAEALETAHRAQRFRTDDHDVWGQITDALVELGDYSGAVKSAQKMVDLRPDSSAYARISYLRSLHGDTYGAIQAMNAAVEAANPNDPEAIAWCRVQLGNELMNAGQLEAAERQFDEALRTFSDHRLALQAKARARIAARDYQSAVKIYQQEEAKSPSADAAQALGDVYTLLGQSEAAKGEYKKFEVLEHENAQLERSWRHMINYWLDHDLNLQEALTLATKEYEARKDIFTCDSLAWAYFKNGQVAGAKKLIEEAVRTKTKDARINYHAGVIYNTLKSRDKAIEHLQLAATLNSSYDPTQAISAKQILSQL